MNRTLSELVKSIFDFRFKNLNIDKMNPAPLVGGRPEMVRPPAQPPSGQQHTPAPGLVSIISCLQRLYPGQRNPMQVTAVVKYWLGGPDPLDYINMFSNTGSNDSEPHWHYVSCGLSDLHGDARVHPPAPTPDHPSGYGFELSFRLRREQGQTQPPTWPAQLLNSIAKYVFESENKLVRKKGQSILLDHLLRRVTGYR